ncbi:MAG: biotin synthetase [Bdellovibrionaceae bacterium]|nr:biotin synthetase [Bdellovibrionales bacterium]MCB9084495.1 biotin synthetase [Pseudobdellovibrionaceae bacterium]
MTNPGFDIYRASREWAIDQAGYHLGGEPTTTSTNDVAKKELLPDDKDCGLYLTQHQTQGRGRGSHSWSDAGKGTALLSTWVFRLRKSPQHVTAPLFGLALFNAARKTWNNLPFSLKAPNDLLLDGKKVGGLLLESLNHGQEFFVLVGLGVNVFSIPEGIEDANHLAGAEGVGDELSVNEWKDFLSHLAQEFASAQELCTIDHLNEHSREDLMRALNSNPRLSSPIVEVEANGDLVQESGKISWQNL